MWDDVWSIAYLPSSSTVNGRPVYVYTRNHYLLDQDDPDKNDLWALIYSGNRWFGVFIDDKRTNQ